MKAKQTRRGTIRTSTYLLLLGAVAQMSSLSANAELFEHDDFVAEGIYNVLGVEQEASLKVDRGSNRIAYDTTIDGVPWELRIDLSTDRKFGFIRYGQDCVGLDVAMTQMPTLQELNQHTDVPQNASLPAGVSVVSEGENGAIILVKIEPVIVNLIVERVTAFEPGDSIGEFVAPKDCVLATEYYGLDPSVERSPSSEDDVAKGQPYIEANRNWSGGSQSHKGAPYRVNFNTTGARHRQCEKAGDPCRWRVHWTKGYYGYYCGAGRSSTHEPLTCTDYCCKLHDLNEYNWCGLHNCLKCNKNSSWWDWTTKFGNDYDAHFVVNTYAKHKCKATNKAKCK